MQLHPSIFGLQVHVAVNFQAWYFVQTFCLNFSAKWPNPGPLLSIGYKRLRDDNFKIDSKIRWSFLFTLEKITNQVYCGAIYTSRGLKLTFLIFVGFANIESKVRFSFNDKIHLYLPPFQEIRKVAKKIGIPNIYANRPEKNGRRRIWMDSVLKCCHFGPKNWMQGGVENCN